jgi:hypothetical protein
LNVMPRIEILWDDTMRSRRALGFPGWTVAVGLPKMSRSVRLMIETFSEQVPLTEMELGPAFGSIAKAAVIVVKAPGVAPEQSTTALAPYAAAGSNTKHRIGRSSLTPEAQNFIIGIFPFRM